jgi:hypothetical protein
MSDPCKALVEIVLMKFKRGYYHFNAMQKYAKPQRTFNEDKMFLRNTKMVIAPFEFHQYNYCVGYFQNGLKPFSCYVKVK